MIRVNNLVTGYTYDKPLKKNINLVFENKVYGIVGKSGCGKSTFLRTVAGLMYPLEGDIYIDNQILKKASKNNIYMMHQNYTSFNWLNCLDNLLITEKVKHHKITKETKDEALQWLDKVGLNGYENKYPTQLSGGMRQRLALARTLYTKPNIILMDEPLSALDEKTRADMQNLILDIHDETQNTIIMVTHSTDEAQKMCDEIIQF